MASNPWTSDVDKAKRELSQRIDKLEISSKSSATADSTKSIALLQRQVAELKNDSEATDRRLTNDIKQINSVFSSAKSSDDALQKQITELKAKVDGLLKASASQKKP